MEQNTVPVFTVAFLPMASFAIVSMGTLNKAPSVQGDLKAATFHVIQNPDPYTSVF